MTDRVSQLATRISEIEKEFSKTEIRKAVKLLEQRGSTSRVQAFLLNDGEGSPTSKPRRKHRRRPVEEERSKAVLDLEHKDSEKYALLSEFDALVRKGSVLPEVIEIRMIGESLSKRFSCKSSRRDAISKLMKVLAEKPLPEIRRVVGDVLSTHSGDDGDSDYYKLAQFIITGKTIPSHGERRI